MIPQELPDPFANCDSNTGAGSTRDGDCEMRPKDGVVQKAWSLLGAILGYFLCHATLHQISVVEEGRAGGVEKYNGKICADSGFCMSVGLSEVLNIHSSCCQERAVLMFTIFSI